MSVLHVRQIETHLRDSYSADHWEQGLDDRHNLSRLLSRYAIDLSLGERAQDGSSLVEITDSGDDRGIDAIAVDPVSSLVGALLFVRPALLARQGLAEPGPDFEVGRATSELRRNARRDEFVRARRTADDRGIALEPVAGQESHMIVRTASADALVHVPRGVGEIASGETVRYLSI